MRKLRLFWVLLLGCLLASRPPGPAPDRFENVAERSAAGGFSSEDRQAFSERAIDLQARGAGGGSEPSATMYSISNAILELGALRLLPWATEQTWLPYGPSLSGNWQTPIRTLQLDEELISDGQFVWGPNVGVFDIAGYLGDRGSLLSDYAPDIELWASYSSVNPKVLLAVLELREGWVSALPTGLSPSDVRSAIEQTAMDIASTYYEHMYVWGSRRTGAAPSVGPTVFFADGTAATLDQRRSSGTVALATSLASRLSGNQFQAQAIRSFRQVFGGMFPETDLLATTNEVNPAAAPPDSLFQLPFPLGATWVGSGPHSWNGGSYPPPFSSVDFFTGGSTCAAPANAYAVAAAYGTANRPSGYTCWLEIDHGGGWVTSYYHLQNLYSGAPIGRDSKVGTISCETCAGGFATGPHLHWSLKYNGAYASLEGVKLSGWTVHVGTVPYNSGSYERDGTVLPAYSALVNDYQSYYSNGYTSLRFYGNGTADIDRLKIRLTDFSKGAPADVGKQDFTIEWWIKALAAENGAPPAVCGATDAWRSGNIVLDRDRWGQDQDYGVSLAGGAIVFGVGGEGTGQLSICGSRTVGDGQWHHVSIQRRRSDGWIWIYVDGLLDAQADGPDGDISYPNGSVPLDGCGGPCVNDPYLVVGAEKHGVDPTLLSFSGWIEELRISNSLRYSGDFTPPVQPFLTDINTVALYHFDDSPANSAYDTSGFLGGPSNGSRRIGGSPEGPVWSSDTPFTYPTPTPSLTPTADPSVSPTVTPTVSSTPAPTETPTPLPTATSTSTSTPTPSSTPTATATQTPLPTATATQTPLPTATPTPLPTDTPTPLPSSTPTPAAGSTQWNLAEGFTGAGFATFILIQNPNPSDATVDVTYLLDSGPPLSRTHIVPAQSRYTIAAHDPAEVGPDQAFATSLASDLPVVVERAMYWIGGGHATVAVPYAE